MSEMVVLLIIERNPAVGRTEGHFAGFLQLRVVGLFDLSVDEDLFERPSQEHFFRRSLLAHVR